MSITHPPIGPANILPRWKKWFFGRFDRFQDWRKRRRQQRIDRLAFQQLLYLDDHLLQDVGYDRADLEDANKLHLDINAAAAVRMLKQEQHSRKRLRR